MMPPYELLGYPYCRPFMAVTMLMLTLILGCAKAPKNKREDSPLAGSRLQSHLSSSHRDGIYCAASYIASEGGPSLPGALPESVADWRAHGEQLLDWLERSETSTVRALVDRFPAYVEKWAPFYPPP